MEAMVATSRSIDPDQFRNRENKRKYGQHIDAVKGIVSQKTSQPVLQQVK